jgi:hypothetical protein
VTELLKAGHVVCRKHFCVPKYCYNSTYCCHIRYFLSGHALLNDSRAAANDFDAKKCSPMNIRSARQYTMLARAKLLRNCQQLQPSNQGNITRVSRRKLGESITSAEQLLISFMYLVCDCCLHFFLKWYTRYNRELYKSARL